MCGGTRVPTGYRTDRWGLSPRVRGNHDGLEARKRRKGSIPACAGEPRHGPQNGDIVRVYPRVCGGTVVSTQMVIYGWGLSPRVRGNPPPDKHIVNWYGSIPACAGEPTVWWSPSDDDGVYPRVCGGTPNTVGTVRLAKGLSPRVRGNRVPVLSWHPKDGVYPRVCGGTQCTRGRRSRASGLSPRVRGNLPCWSSIRASRGSIPACAGEP